MDTNMVTSNGGLQKNHASAMGMQANLLKEAALAEQIKAETGADTAADDLT